jgi:hypothetical protein
LILSLSSLPGLTRQSHTSGREELSPVGEVDARIKSGHDDELSPFERTRLAMSSPSR